MLNKFLSSSCGDAIATCPPHRQCWFFFFFFQFPNGLKWKCSAGNYVIHWFAFVRLARSAFLTLSISPFLSFALPPSLSFFFSPFLSLSLFCPSLVLSISDFYPHRSSHSAALSLFILFYACLTTPPSTVAPKILKNKNNEELREKNIRSTQRMMLMSPFPLISINSLQLIFPCKKKNLHTHTTVKYTMTN